MKDKTPTPRSTNADKSACCEAKVIPCRRANCGMDCCNKCHRHCELQPATPPASDGELREKIVKQMAEFYFIHCKPDLLPQFKTVEESENWKDKHLFQIQRIVSKEVDQILALFREWALESLKNGGEDDKINGICKKCGNPL